MQRSLKPKQKSKASKRVARLLFLLHLAFVFLLRSPSFCFIASGDKTKQGVLATYLVFRRIFRRIFSI
jgi:hypothetical protein